MVINPRIGRCLNQTIIGYRTVEQTPWDRLPIGLRIYSKGLSALSDRHLTILTQRDGCKQARAAQEPRTGRTAGFALIFMTRLYQRVLCHLRDSLNPYTLARGKLIRTLVSLSVPFVQVHLHINILSQQ